jgi:polyisoprenoid-binding protein YceI
VRRSPEIRFDATVEGTGDRRRLVGRLALHGRERATTVEARLEGGAWRARATVHQPDFGITPYTALLGTLRVRPDVIVEVSLPA